MQTESRKKTMAVNKVIRIIAIAFIAVITFCACGKKETKKEISQDLIIKTTDTLIQEKVFESNMQEVTPKVALNAYQIDSKDIEVEKAYMGDGASAEEVVVFKTTDYNSMKKTIDNYIKDRKECFHSYLPEQEEVLEHALIKQYKNYTIVCIAKDHAHAEKVIKKVAG